MRFWFFRWLIEKPWRLKIVVKLCKGKWFKRKLDRYLEKLIKKPFKHKKYKAIQNNYMLSVKKREGDWLYVIKLKKPPKTRAKKNRKYNYKRLLVGEKYHVLEMRKVK
jgi:hypothetical protein